MNAALSHIMAASVFFPDIDTRRRAACDLVRGLCKFFEGPVTAIFSGYVNSMLTEYAKNPAVNWKHKDAAIYLVTSLASKAQTQKVRIYLPLFIWASVTSELCTFCHSLKKKKLKFIWLSVVSEQHGITQANELVNLMEFFVNHILPDLRSPNGKQDSLINSDKRTCTAVAEVMQFCPAVFTVNEFPVLKADAIKYVMTFRSQVSACFFRFSHLSCVFVKNGNYSFYLDK